jgi:hypothetical protein
MAQVLPFNGFYAGNSAKNSSRTCVNFMPVRHDEGALSEYTLETTTGIASPTSGTYSGSETSAQSIDSQVINWGGNNNPYTEGVYTVTGNGILIGSNGSDLRFYDMARTFAVSFGKYRMSTSSQSMLIMLEGDVDSIVHVYSGSTSTGAADLSSVFSNLLLPSDTAFFGGRFLLMSGAGNTNDNNRRVYYSDILDPIAYSQLNFFSSIEQDSTNKGIHVLNNRLYLFSDSGYTVWAVTSDVNLPFAQQKGSNGSVGLIEPSAKCEVDETLYFIGRSGGSIGFFALRGGQTQRISSKEIEQSIISDEVFVNSRCFSFYDEGVLHVAFSILNLTYCLNLSTGEYHKRSTNGTRWAVLGTGNTTDKFAATGSGFSNSQVFVAGACNLTTDGGVKTITANISLADNEVGTEFGGQVSRECVTSPFNSNGVTNNVRELSFLTDIDYSTASPSPSVAPQLGLSVSKTFGKTFETEELRDFDIGTENTKILRYLNIGFFRQAFVFKIKSENIYPHKILKMLVRLEKGFRQI